MSMKRTLVDLDPDYEDITEQQWKKQKILQDDAKESTVKKIEKIIQKHFNVEIQYKEAEVKLIDQRLHEARHVLDRLRACIVANYYSGAGQLTGQTKPNPNQPPVIHPAVKKYLGKTVKHPLSSSTENTAVSEVTARSQASTNGIEEIKSTEKTRLPAISTSSLTNVNSVGKGQEKYGPRCKVKKRIVVGNVSKYIPPDKRDDNDRATHKWMVYVRGPRDEPHIDHFVKKVWFFLHPSYRPNDLVEISQPPFHLTRRGWGEFPVRVQLHFIDGRNKRVDIIHHLKLDKTYTGLQTLGSETHVDIELDRATLPQENIPITPPVINENNVVQQGQRSEENQKTEENVSACELTDVKQETESENSLGVVWSPVLSHDQMKSHDLSDDPALDLLTEPDITSEQSILESVLQTDDPEHGLMGKEQSMLVKDDVLLSSEACRDLEAIKNAPVSDPKSESRSRSNPSEGSSSSGRLQISRDVVSEGWTRLQIKHEEGHEPSPLTNGTLSSKTTEIKDEPVDDTYPSVLTSASVNQPSSRTKSLGFQPITADPTQPGAGWMHIQIKSEPASSERSASVCSGRTELLSPAPEGEVQMSVPSSPCTPDRSKAVSGVDKPSVLSTPAEHNSRQSALDGGNEFSTWKRVKGTSGGGLRKQMLTLGVGVGQLSSGIQSEAGMLLGQPVTSKASSGHENETSVASSSGQVTTSTVSSSLKGLESLSLPSQSSTTKQGTSLDAVYIQCVDASGKVYLIPQQMLKTTTVTEQKHGLKPVANSLGKKDAIKTTAVASGPNKAMLTYMLSSQASRATRPLLTPTSKTPVPAVPLAMPTAATSAQKLLVIPGAGSNPRQLALVQQPKQNNTAVISPTLQLGSTSCQSRPLLIRDQAGNMQIVQMVPPSSLIQTSALPGSSPLLSGKTLQSKNTHPKSGIRMTGGEKSLLSPPAASAKPATAVLADGSTQLSPLKSLVISKETLGQLQPGQLLQIEIPQSKASSVGPDTSHIAGLMHNRGKPMSGLEKVDTRPTAIVQQGTVMSKPAGGVSLLRPGLITSKHSSAGLVTGSKSSSAVFVGGRLSTPGLVAKQTLSGISTPSPSAASSVQMTIVGSTPNLLTKKVNTAETPKCSLIGQSLLKSASTGCLMSLHQKQAEATQKKNEADNKGRPLYLSTKIGNQTVLLKFDNEQDAKRTLAADLGSSRDSKAADDVGAISLIHPPSSSMAVEKSILKSSANLASGQKVAALTGVSAALTPTIKHGSILGIHKQREPCKSDNFEINLTKFADFESLLMFVVPRYPLVEENVDRSVHPYSAHSETEFLGWNVGKRRAAEWQRASRVRKQILSALQGESSFHGQKVWSTKEIMTWCRQHLYSPLDNALAAKYSKNEQQKRRHKTSVSHPPGGFCSYTDHKRVLTTISDLSRSPGGSSEDEEIDIIGIEQPTKNVVKTEPLETDVDGEDVIPAEVISLCPLTQYIHQVAAQIGVNFEPVLLLLDDGSKVYMSVSEEVIVSALKCFINGLIRKAVALRHHSDRFLDEVNPRDVYDALESLPRTDFLLNTGLGTRLMSHCNTDETGSDV